MLPGKIIMATQHYPPDNSTTAVYLGQIAKAFTTISKVLVLAGTSGSSSTSTEENPEDVVELPCFSPKKQALVRRSIAICAFSATMFFSVLHRARRDDVVFAVTTPFTLPYAAILAARLRGASTALLIYDLYPEALEAAGLVSSGSFVARLLRFANAFLFRTLDAIVVIGRDVPPLLQRYNGVSERKIHFIPNWALLPIGYQEIDSQNRFRSGLGEKFIVGLSGNLGFTHDPKTVFEAARLLRKNTDIYFLLSGWGIGWKELRKLAAAEKLSNVTMLDPVVEADLIEFLSAANVWAIPYRRNIAGVSIPSRLYNLMAVGRPAIVGAETHSEAAIELNEEGIGWVVSPEDPVQLATAIEAAATDRLGTIAKGRRAALVAQKYSAKVAAERYCHVLGQIERRRSCKGSGSAE
jgi:glycosyltransferase involved in cell wall biosynthesis